MAIHTLSKESFGNIMLVNGVARHKFLALPTLILFGDDKERHQAMMGWWGDQATEDPELFDRQRQLFADQNLKPCGNHSEAKRLGVVDAGLMIVEGIATPQTVEFTSASSKYGAGDRMRAQAIIRFTLRGNWKFHLDQ